MKHYSVAMDGPSGSGKSSMAKKIAADLGFVYVDTGAIYRTVGLACYRRGIELKNEEAVKSTFPELNIEIRYDGEGLQRMFLNGEDVTTAIRLPEISMAASNVSAHPATRAFLMDMQRRFAREYNVIMDGRDIATVVLPDADVKIYLTASAASRAKRRMLELQQKGIGCDFEEVLKDIEQRDYQDMHRETAPLRQAEDAVLVDSSEMNIQETYDALCKVITSKIPVGKRQA